MTDLAHVRPGQLRSGVLLDAARRALAEAETLPDIAALVDRAEVVRVAARKAKLSLEAINDWAEFKLDAERRAGELLARMEKNSGGRPAENPSPDARGFPPKLSDLGVTYNQAAKWQQVASLPEEEYEAYKAETRAEKDIISTAGAVARAKELVREQRNADLLARPVVPLTTGPFEVLYVDPPWQYDWVETERRAIENQYPTMALDEIKALDVPAADSAVLFLWATSPKLAEALEVMAAWGFDYRTSLVWVKDRIGMGYYARQQHELLLVGRRGDLPVPEPSDRPASVIQSPREQHSAKPEVVYGLLERMYPYRSRVELFARNSREGWAAWGNQA